MYVRAPKRIEKVNIPIPQWMPIVLIAGPACAQASGRSRSPHGIWVTAS